MWAWGIAWAMALVSAFYIWSVLDSDTQQAEHSTAARDDVLGVPHQSGVDAYRAYVASPGVSPGPSHEYAAKGIEHLAEAIRAAAEAHRIRDGMVAKHVQSFPQMAARLRADPTALDHADIVREVFSATVDTLEYIQRTRRLDSPGLQARISELRQLARAVDPGEPLLQQQGRVRQFFERSAEALRRLANG